MLHSSEKQVDELKTLVNKYTTTKEGVDEGERNRQLALLPTIPKPQSIRSLFGPNAGILMKVYMLCILLAFTEKCLFRLHSHYIPILNRF